MPTFLINLTAMPMTGFNDPQPSVSHSQLPPTQALRRGPLWAFWSGTSFLRLYRQANVGELPEEKDRNVQMINPNPTNAQYLVPATTTGISKMSVLLHTHLNSRQALAGLYLGPTSLGSSVQVRLRPLLSMWSGGYQTAGVACSPST